MQPPRFIRTIRSHPSLCAFLWIGVVFLAGYGVLLPFVGIYGDDWGYLWLLFKGDGIDLFLRHNRAATAPVFTFLSHILGANPLAWQSLNFAVRWVTVWLFWLVLDQVWPEEKRWTLLAAILLAVYPGYKLGYVPINMMIFWMVLGCLFLSFYLNLVAVRQTRLRWLWITIALICSALNLTLTEYYYFTELVRPMLIFLAVSQNAKEGRFHRTLRSWLPFLLLFAGTILWRTFNQSSINGFYTLRLLEDFKAAPLETARMQLGQMAQDVWKVTVGAWNDALSPTRLLKEDHISSVLYYGGMGLLIILLVILQWKVSPRSKQSGKALTGWLWVGAGIIWCLLSGWPIWLAELRIGVDFASTRFAQPLMCGAVLIAVGLVRVFTAFPRLQRILIAVLVGSSISMQLLVGNSYRMDWQSQKAFYTQLYWRFGGIQSGTMFIVNQSPSSEGEENTLAAEINWFFSPKKSGPDIDYFAYFIPEHFASDNPGLLDGQQVYKGHHIGAFTASRDQIVAVYIDSRNCLRVLYPGIDTLNPRLNDFLVEMTPYSHPEAAITPEQADTAQLLTEMFGSQTEQGWCRLYQQADRMRVNQDWEGIAAISSQIDPADFNQDWQKLALFIEADARTGDMPGAARLLKEVSPVATKNRELFCKLSDPWLHELQPQGEFKDQLHLSRTRAQCTNLP